MVAKARTKAGRQQEIFQAARTAGGKPAQLFAENKDQDQSQPETGNREHDISKVFDEVIKKAAAVNCTDAAKKDTAHTCHQQREYSQLQRHRQALRDLGGNVAAGDIAAAKIALQNSHQPQTVAQPHSGLFKPSSSRIASSCSSLGAYNPS